MNMNIRLTTKAGYGIARQVAIHLAHAAPVSVTNLVMVTHVERIGSNSLD
jgi:hypothetical protein